jgi:protein-S-isoprenylcysteine O-methyltransferase Ste14
MTRFFDMFQLASLGVFILILLGRSLFLYSATGANPLPLGIGKTGMQRVVEWSFAAGFIAWCFEVIAAALPLDRHLFHGFMYVPLVDAIGIKVFGVVLMLFSFGIFIAALAAMGNSWRLGIDRHTPGKLVTGGIFAVSRNPIYAAIDLYYIAAFLINGTLLFLLFALAVVSLMHYQVLQEEKTLPQLYGGEYRAYCRRTGRYF